MWMTMGWSHVLANSSVLIEQRQVVAVNRPQVAHPHFLENDRAAETAAAVRVHQAAGLLQADVRDRALETLLRLVRRASMARSPLGNRRRKFWKSLASLL